MSEDGWRTSIRWVVAHPTEARVLLARRDGALWLPGSERPGQVWTAEPGQVLPGLRDLSGADALLLRTLEDDDDPRPGPAGDPAGRPRAVPALPTARLGRAADWPVATGTPPWPARVVEELAGAGTARRPAWAPASGSPRRELAARHMEGLGRPLVGPLEQVSSGTCRVSCGPDGGRGRTGSRRPRPHLFVNEGVGMGELRAVRRRVPAPLAVDPERGWMVLDDLGRRSAGRRRSRSSRRWSGPSRDAGRGGRPGRPAARRRCQDRRLERLADQARAWLPAIEATAELAGIDPATWLSEDETAALRAALPRFLARCEELAGYGVPPSIVHGDLHLGNVARGPAGYLFFDWTDACVAHPFFDLATIRRGTGFEEAEGESELRDRLRAAYLPAWSSFEPADRLDRAFQLAVPLAAMHHAVSYRSLVAGMVPPVEPHMARSTAWWLRQVLAGLS